MKYSSKHEEYVHQVAVEHGEEGGAVSEPLGWFARIDLDPGRGGYEKDAVDYYGTQWFLVRENDHGVATTSVFPSAEKRDELWEKLSDASALFNAEISDDDALLAIRSYLEAALFTATDEEGDLLDNGERSWAPAAQTQARRDVVDFITANTDDIREFMRVTGHEWTQIGIDFSLTRNRHGAGFWDRGAGESGDRLTAAAKACGEISVSLSDDGELVFS